MLDDLGWTVEEACGNAWPSRRSLLLGPWILRVAGGPSRRINAVSPLRGATAADVGPMLAAAAPVYAAHGQPLVVRAPGHGYDDALASAGFVPEGETRTLLKRFSAFGEAEVTDVVLAPRPDAAWLALRAQLNNDDPAAAQALGDVLTSLALPVAFASAGSGAGAQAIAYGAIHAGLMVLEAVGTDPAVRRQGHGRRVVSALLAWARRAGATAACLQVVADNAPARQLYADLGFAEDLYGYRYWRRPA